MCEDLSSIDVYGYNVHYITKENNKAKESKENE